jgi:predicted dehydrogenase
MGRVRTARPRSVTPGQRRERDLTTSQPPLRLGIAGTGFIGQLHAHNAAASEAVELVAIASARGAEAAATLAQELGNGVRALSLERLFCDDDVEAVLVATRTSDHAAHAVEVLRNGKHLLLEKPGAITLSDQQLIADAAAGCPGPVVRVAYHRRHDPRFRELQELLAQGAIGEPYAVHSISREDFPPSDDDRYSGGFITDVGVHDFDTARWLLGEEPDTVYALAHAPVYADSELDNVYVTVNYDRSVASVQLSRTSRVGLEIRFEVIGSEGSALLAQAPFGGGITVSTAARAHEFPADCRAAFADAYRVELADFAACCRGQRSPGATLADDRWAVATAVAARASVVRGQALVVGPDWEWELDGSDPAPRSRTLPSSAR